MILYLYEQAKDVAERKAREAIASMEAVKAEIRNEKQVSSSAMNLARKANRENDMIKRAIQSLGCRIHVSGNDDCTIDIETNVADIPQRITSSSMRETGGSEEKTDMPISVTITADNNDVSENPILRVCESLCPQRTREGGCKWPDAGCAQLESQFVGLRANYDAFDRLSIYDSYFQPK